MTTPVDSCVTPGDIARSLGEPQHRIAYILDTRRTIVPLRRAGIVRLYPSSAIEAVRGALAEIDARRGGRP